MKTAIINVFILNEMIAQILKRLSLSGWLFWHQLAVLGLFSGPRRSPLSVQTHNREIAVVPVLVYGKETVRSVLAGDSIRFGFRRIFSTMNADGANLFFKEESRAPITALLSFLEILGAKWDLV